MKKAEREYGKKLGYTDKELDKIDENNKKLLGERIVSSELNQSERSKTK